MTAAIPRPKITTSRNPNAGRPATIDPNRMISALVEGIRPPARPRANSPRQLIVDPAAGRWRVADAAVAVLAGAGASGPCSCSCSWEVLVALFVDVVTCVLVIVRMPVSCDGRGSGCQPAADLPREHPPADREDRHGRDHRGAPDHDVRRQHSLRADDEARQHEDPERVRDRDREPKADGVKRRAARADKIGRHQRLAVPGRQGMAGAQAESGQDRQRARTGSGRLAEDRRQLPADPAGYRAGDLRRPRRLTGLRPGRARRGAAGRRVRRDDDRRRADVDRLRDEILRIGRQSRGRARRGEPPASIDTPCPSRRSPATRSAPDRRRPRRSPSIASGRRELRDETALDPHRRQAAESGWERDRGVRCGQRRRGPVDGQPEELPLPIAGRPDGRRGLGIGDVAVAVGVHRLALLERRDLGHVDHDVEPDLAGRQRDSRVMVDREVAERVGEDRRPESAAPEHGESGGAEQSTSHHAEGTRPTEMDDRRLEIEVPVGPERYTRMRDTTPPPAQRGSFITIEGPEGAGKTTQAARLEEYLRGERHRRDPNPRTRRDEARGAAPRPAPRPGAEHTNDPLADALLFNAARRQLVEEVIRPAIDAGTTVICTRFADSTLAYQGYGAGVPLASLRALERSRRDGLRPDLTILLDLPPEIGLGRKAPGTIRRGSSSAFDLAFHRRVREGFLTLAAAEPDRFAIVDAEPAAAQAGSGGPVAVAGRPVPAAPGEPERQPQRIHP